MTVVPIRGGIGPTGTEPSASDEAELIVALREGSPGAAAVLFDRYAVRVRRVLARILGREAEMADLVQEVFLRALEGVGRLEAFERVDGWLTCIAVYTARETLRHRTRWRWLKGEWSVQQPAPVEPGPVAESSQALRSTYAVLEQMPADERIAFALRFVEQMELTQVAQATGVSLATVKRRLAKAERRFLALAKHQPALEPWLSGGGRWPTSP
jgi:RNA polymerase sigma-70 factor (ECF subfamily)